MVDLRAEFRELFDPFERAKKSGWRFVHYTSAESALQILESKRVWMRNAQLMNDFEEIHGGIRHIVDFFRDDSETGKPLWAALERVKSGLAEQTSRAFEAWHNDLVSNTYILCLSLHDEHEDNDGRLSMWRAYSGSLGGSSRRKRHRSLPRG